MPFRVTSPAICLLVLLLGAPFCLAGDKPAVPDWVRQAAAQTLPSYPPDTDAVVLLDEVTYNVSAPGEFVEQRQRAVKILRQSGIDESRFFIHFDKGEKVSSVHGWSIDPAGHEFEVKDKEFNEVLVSTESLYDDVRTRVAKVPAQVGSVVAFQSEVRRRSFFDQFIWIPQEPNPIRHTSLTLQLPAGFEYKDLWYGMTPISPSTSGSNRWQWTLTDLPRIKHEESMPDFNALAARMKLTYFGPGMQTNTDSWASLGKWYNGLTADRRTATPEMVAKAKQLVEAKTDFVARARAVAEFMQQEVRYVAIEIGVGGFQPHPASDVFRARYGDCKDKATLLSTMLREVGIASDYVIIDTDRGVVKPDMPSSMFNHVILAIEIPSGTDTSKLRSLVKDKSSKEYLLFDPTNTETPLGEIPTYLQDTYALLVTPASGEIIHTPVLDPDFNRNLRRGKFKLDADGTLQGSVEGKMVGHPASVTRDMYRSRSEQERLQTAERYVSYFVKSATLKDLKVDALDRNSEELGIHYNLTSEKYAQITGPLMLVRPRVLGQHAVGLEKKERKYPIELGSTALDDDEFEIEIPSGYVVDDVPEPKKIDSSFASYESHFNVSGSKITYKRTFINRALEISPEKIAEFRTFQNQIADDENAVVVLKKAN
jgi:hypothetical protein